MKPRPDIIIRFEMKVSATFFFSRPIYKISHCEYINVDANKIIHENEMFCVSIYCISRLCLTKVAIYIKKLRAYSGCAMSPETEHEVTHRLVVHYIGVFRRTYCPLEIKTHLAL